jgi:hypothetical protein
MLLAALAAVLWVHFPLPVILSAKLAPLSLTLVIMVALQASLPLRLAPL